MGAGAGAGAGEGISVDARRISVDAGEEAAPRRFVERVRK